MVFEPIQVENLKLQEKKKAMEHIIFPTYKRNNTIKACTCTNDSTQRSYIAKDDAASPTAATEATEAIIITCVIEAKQGHNVMMLDVPNAFVQIQIPENKERIIIKIHENLIICFAAGNLSRSV
jgi:hypothetical protein